MDSLLLKSGFINGRKAMLAVVCDGVGSMADGAYASITAVKIMNEWFDNVKTADLIGTVMRNIVLNINLYIIKESKLKNIYTASTFSALLLVESDYYISHIGDSRIYCLENGRLCALTNDDVSPSGELTAYIGKNENILPQYREGTAAGKIFLICSDGLYRRMDKDFMTVKLKNWNKKSFDETIKILPQYVINLGEQDNISFALVKIED